MKWNRPTVSSESCLCWSEVSRYSTAQHREVGVFWTMSSAGPEHKLPLSQCGKWIDWNRRHTNNRQMDTLCRMEESFTWWNGKRSTIQANLGCWAGGFFTRLCKSQKHLSRMQLSVSRSPTNFAYCIQTLRWIYIYLSWRQWFSQFFGLWPRKVMSTCDTTSQVHGLIWLWAV